MVAKSVVVAEPSGLHLRPAGILCGLCQKYQSKIEIKKDNITVNAKSVLGLLSARVQNGDEIEVICSGADEQSALDGVVRAIEEGLGLTEV